MNFDCDYQAEAVAAMEMAAAATNEAERLKWLRVALAWQDLARAPQAGPGKSRLQGTS